MFEIILVFILGLVLGSFANVCIYRMPRDLSIVRPNSHCTNCNTAIKWYDNIPVLSYIFLRGKCRKCGSKISFRYPMVELACAFLFLLMYYLFGFSCVLIPFCLFSFSLLVITVIDFDFQIIPDEISLFLVVLGLGFSFCNTILGDTVLSRILNSFFGLLAGGGSLLLIAIIGKWIFGKDAMGGGDIKIMAGVGTFIGWDRVLFAIFIACFIGGIVGLFMMIFKKIGRKQEIPFGPYLAVASLLVLFLPSPEILVGYIFSLEEEFLVKYVFTNLQEVR